MSERSIEIIKQGNKVSARVTDEKGDDIMMKLLKKGKYEVVLNHMKDIKSLF